MFNKDPQQPGLSNALQPARLEPADGEAGKAPAVWGDNRLLRTRGQAASTWEGESKRGSYGCPASGWRAVGPDLLLVLGGDLQLLVKPAAQGQDKWRWTKLGPAKFKLDITKKNGHPEGGQTLAPKRLRDVHP